MNLVIPQIDINDYGTLSIDQFKEMDYQSVDLSTENKKKVTKKYTRKKSKYIIIFLITVECIVNTGVRGRGITTI